MEKSSKRPYLLFAMATIVIVTIATFYLLNIERTELRYWALFFVVLSELTLFSGIIITTSKYNNSKNLFLVSGSTVTLALYFIATVTLSVWAAVYIQDIKTLILIEVGITTLLVLTLVALTAFSKHINYDNESVLNNRTFIDGIEQRVRLICLTERNTPNEALLIDLYETIKHSDKSGSSMQDSRIEFLVNEIEQSMKSRTVYINLIQDLNTVLAQRSAEIVTNRRGNI